MDQELIGNYYLFCVRKERGWWPSKTIECLKFLYRMPGYRLENRRTPQSIMVPIPWFTSKNRWLHNSNWVNGLSSEILCNPMGRRWQSSWRSFRNLAKCWKIHKTFIEGTTEQTTNKRILFNNTKWPPKMYWYLLSYTFCVHFQSLKVIPCEVPNWWTSDYISCWILAWHVWEADAQICKEISFGFSRDNVQNSKPGCTGQEESQSRSRDWCWLCKPCKNKAVSKRGILEFRRECTKFISQGTSGILERSPYEVQTCEKSILSESSKNDSVAWRMYHGIWNSIVKVYWSKMEI